jgi:hypothetical protein
MTKQLSCGLLWVLCVGGLACSSGTNAPASPLAGTGAAGVAAPGFGSGGAIALGSGGAIASSGSAGVPVANGSGGVGAAGRGTAGTGVLGSAGTGAAGMAAAGSGGMAAAGAAGRAGAGGAGGMGGSAGSSAGSLTGTVGALGPAKPVVNGWATTNGLETLIYLSSSPLTCAMMMTQGTKWLSTLPAGTQVFEIVVGASPAAQTYMLGGAPAAFGGGEVNYAEGSMSSSTEVTGTAGSVTLTKTTPMGAQDGMISVTAPFMVSGTFHAEWCQGGTEY